MAIGGGGAIVSLDDLVDAIEAHERRSAQIALAAAHLESTAAWAADGSLSMSSWLQHHCRMTPRVARRLIHEGRFLRRHEVVADAAVSARLSASKWQPFARSSPNRWPSCSASIRPPSSTPLPGSIRSPPNRPVRHGG